MPSLRQWTVVRNIAEDVLTAGHSYGLQNLDVDRFIRYGEREWGINLVWDKDFEGVVFFRHRDTRGQPIRYGDRIAIAVANGGYLRYESRRWGINLVWSRSPVYEWELQGGGAGQPIAYAGNRLSIYNRTERDHVVYCSRPWGINLKWADDCTSFDPPIRTAGVGITYRIPLPDIFSTGSSFGTVTFHGDVTAATGNGGNPSFTRTDHWEASPNSDFGLATATVGGLTPGTWRLTATSPVWSATCDVDLPAGTNNASVNFQERSNGCARGLSWPTALEAKDPQATGPAEGGSQAELESRDQLSQADGLDASDDAFEAGGPLHGAVGVSGGDRDDRDDRDRRDDSDTDPTRHLLLRPPRA